MNLLKSYIKAINNIINNNNSILNTLEVRDMMLEYILSILSGE